MSERNEVDAEQAVDYRDWKDLHGDEDRPKPNEYEDDRPRWKR